MDSETPECNSQKQSNKNQRKIRINIEQNLENAGKRQRKVCKKIQKSKQDQQLENQLCQNIERGYNSLIDEIERNIKIIDFKIKNINKELRKKSTQMILQSSRKKKDKLEIQRTKLRQKIDSIKIKIKREQKKIRQIDDQIVSELYQSPEKSNKMIQENNRGSYQKQDCIARKRIEVLQQAINLSNLYYDREIYTNNNYQIYKKLLGQYSNYVDQETENNYENEIQYKCSLKLQFLKIYRMYLQDNDDFQNLWLAWKVIRTYFYNLLEQSQINFLVFKLPMPGAEEIYRLFLIRRLFNRTLTLLMSSNLKNQPLQHILGQSKLRSDRYLLYILTARQSFTYYDPQLRAKLKEMVSLLKKSWYFRTVLLRFFKGRQAKLNEMKKNEDKQEIEITPNLIKDNLSELQIYFVDYPHQYDWGRTDTSDPNKEFPIFINSFPIYSKFGYNINKICSYFMWIIILEIEHSLIRKIGFVKQGSYLQNQKLVLRKSSEEKNISRSYNQQRDEVQNGDWLFERFLFGGRVQYFSQYDYTSIKPLLEYQQNPFKDQQWSCIGNEQKCSSFLQQNENHHIERKIMTRKNNQTPTKIHQQKTRTKKVILQLKNIDQQIKKLEKELAQMQECTTPRKEEKNVDPDNFEPKITDKYFRKFSFITQQLHIGSKTSISQQLSTTKKKKSQTSQQIENDQKTEIQKMINTIQKFGERKSDRIFKVGQNYINIKRSLSEIDSDRGASRRFLQTKPCKLEDWGKP